MDYLKAIIFGLVQGITEFLPISSSGHLVILHRYISLPLNNELAFDVILHLATLLAVSWFFRKEILILSSAWLKSLGGLGTAESKLAWLIMLATLPAVLFGLFFETAIETIFRSEYLVVVMLVAVAMLFIITEKFSRQGRDLASLNWRRSLAIGLAQVIALLPGTSRSGITIISGMAAGLQRPAAVRFSFLLSMPVILGATIKKAPDLVGAGLIGREIIILIIAFSAALISGWLTVNYFLRFSQRHSLAVFAIYRFALAGSIILLLALS